MTEPKRSQNPKRPLPSAHQPRGYSIFLNALNSAHHAQAGPDSVAFASAAIISGIASATPAVASGPPGLEIKLTPALSLPGDVGSNYRIEYAELPLLGIGSGALSSDA